MHRLSRLRLPHYAFAAAFGLALLAAPAAQAFTIDNQSGTNPDGTAKFADPANRFSGAGATSNNGVTTLKQGNTTLQFGNRRSFDQRYNPDNMFEPNGRPSGER